MKSIKRCFLQFIGFFTLLLFIVPSCQIGLGSSVDTEAPELMITGPEAASIIRGNFAINGTWADDGEIESVTCVLTETESKELTYSFTADFTTSKTEVGKGSWSAIVEKDSIRDGSYEVAVTIEDKAGHKTKATRQLTVDNTAPVVVLKRPSSKKGQTDDIDGYGQVFSLKGLAADDSGVGRIEINIYDDENLTTLLKTITKTNVPNTISLDVAEFEEGVENDYSVIYGSTNRSSGVQKRYCRITAYDGAQQYPTDGSEQTDDDKKGNASKSYYLYEDISNTLLAQYKITEIYAIKNGTYNADSSVRSAVTTSLGESEIEVGMFTLNPANEPKYTVSGYSELNLDGKDFATEAHYVKNGTTLNIDVKPGLDSYAILPDTLKVSLQKCDTLGNGIGSVIKPDYTVVSKGTSYSISVKITKDDGLKIGETYLIKVEGQDEKGNNVATPNGKGYGFYLDSSGVKPTIKVTFPESDATVTYKEDTNPASITISGTAFFPSDTFDSEDGATVLIRNSSGSLEWDVTTLTDSQTDTDVPWSITLDFKKENSESADSNNKLYLPDGNHSLGAYIISGSDFDTAEYKVKADINIRLDTQKPKEPVLTKLTDASEKVYAADTWYSAQDLKATLTVGDIARDGYASSSTPSALLSTEYKNGENGTWKSLSSPTGGYITELVDGENTLYFRSTDAVGNVSEISNEYKIHVDTLVPEIIEAKIGSGDGDSNWKTLTSGSVLNIGNNFGKNIKLRIKEARMLAEENGVTVKVGGNTLAGTYTRDGGENSTSEYWTWESSAPASFTADKETAITVVAKDGAGGISETVTYSLLVDTKGPVIEILSPAEELKAADSAKKDFTFKASINDEKGNVSETKYRYVQDLTSNTAWETATNKGSINQSVTLTEGYWYFCVKSTDEAGNESSKNQGFWVDENAPALGTSTKPEAIYNYNDLTNGAGTIALAGTATDTHGVEKLQYSTDGTNWNDASITAGTASSWNISIPFGTGGLSDGTKTIYAKAVDKAGRETTESYEILIDTNKPSLGTPVIAETKNSAGWYNDSELNVSVEASDTTGGSGVSLVQYSLDNSKWTPLSYNEKTKKYEGPVKFSSNGDEFSSNGDDLKLYIKATDKADNDSDTKELSLKIDSGSPVIVAKYYKAGTQGQFGTFGGNAYINNTNASEVMKVWGQCSDSVSGIAGLEAYIGSTKITGLTFKYSSSALPADESGLGSFSETCDSIASWYVEIPTTKFTSGGALTIKALDKAGNSTTAQQTTTVVIDTTKPEIQSSSVIIKETTAGSKTSAYRYSESDSEIVYYVNNSSEKTFEIYGSSTDDYGISATTITINGVNHDASNAQSWSFSGDEFKLSDITGDSTEVTVTTIDKAGNTCEKKITINFDNTNPEFTHRVDANGKDLDFRIGGDVDVTQDIGGKYKTGSWSTSNTLTVRGTTEESGSGLARIYYKVFNSAPDDDDISSFKSNYQTEKTGTIEVSGSAGKRTVDYTTKDENGNEGRDSLEIESSYKGTLTGLYEGSNYLLLIAEDKVGNTAIDSMTATSATGDSLPDAVKTAWNANNNYYSLNIDTKAPSLTSSSSGTKYTNGKSNIKVSGTCSDTGSRIKDLVVSVQIGTDTKTADIVYDTTDPTKWTATFEASEDYPLGVSGGTRYNIDAVATDVAGLSSTLTIAVLQGDTQAPTATLTNVSPSAKESTSGAYYINPSKEIKVEGSTEDDYSTSIKTWFKLVPVISSDEVETAAVDISKDSPKTTRSWSIKIDANKIPAGTYTGYNIYACTEDQAGNKEESTEPAQITFDTAAPKYVNDVSGNYITKIGNYAYYDGYVTGTTTPKVNDVYQKTTTLALKGAWYDDSGVGDIYYKVVNGTIAVPSSKDDCSSSFSVTESNGYAVFNTSIDGFVNGENKIYLFATDKLDNESTAATILTVNVDTNEPVANTYTDTDGVEYKFDAVYLSDGKSDKILYFYADDTLSGIDTSVTPTITLGGESVTKGSNARFEGSETDEGYLVKVTMKADDVIKKSGFRSVEVTVQDKAGNKANLEIATMNVDTTAPTVTLSNPDDADTDTSDIEVNGTITISGNASDPYIAARPLSKLQYIAEDDYSTDKTNWTDWVTDFSAANTNVTNSENFSVKVNTTSLTDGTYYVRAAAKDDAGNEGWSWTTKDTTDPLKIVVNQDTDRPLITLKDIKIPTVDEDATKVTLGLAKRELRGTVTDDDGVKTFEISYKGGKANTWKTITVGKGGSWSDSTSDEIKTDGTYDIVFRVTDKSSETGKAFTSVISGTTTGDTPKFKFSDDEGTVTHDYKTLPLSLIVDNAAPVSSSITFAYYDGTYSETNPARPAYSDTIPTVGGNRKKLAIKIDASDANKIAGISSSLGGTAEKVGDDNETDKVYYSTWVLKDIDVSGLDSGLKDLTLTITDGAGNKNTNKYQMVVDNTVPTLSISEPSSTSTNSGSVTVSGEIDSSDARYLYYAISPSGIIKPNADSTGKNTVTSWQTSTSTVTDPAISAKPVYSDSISFGISWRIAFDGNTSNTTSPHADLLSSYLEDYGITSDASTFDTIVKLYLWVKAVDEVGNENEQVWPIIYDPQGDKPEVKISYPDDNSNGTTLARQTDIYGTHQDLKGSSGNVGVDTVWVQIISEAHKTETVSIANKLTYSASKEIETFKITKADLDYMVSSGYHVYKMKDYVVGGTNNTAKWSSSSTDTNYSDYAALATVSGASWRLTIDENGEFNPIAAQTSGKNTVGIRVFARDKDKKLSNPADRLVFFDSNAPILENLTLVRKNGDTVVSKRPYTADMYISFKKLNDDDNPKWYLKGLAADDGQITEVTINNDVQTITAAQLVNFSYELVKPANAGDAGAITFVITAKDNVTDPKPNTVTENISIKYDDVSPVVTTSGTNFNIASTIKQSQGLYTFGSLANEDSIVANNTSYAQSGYAYTAFFFKRQYGTTTKVYDVLNSSSLVASTDTTEVTGSVVLPSALTQADGLYWYEKAVTRSTTNLNQLTMTDVTGVHENALVKIGGAYYLVTDVSGSTVTIDGYPDSSYETAYVAVAGIIDNTGSRDDGDNMAESVVKTGTSWAWEASVVSSNISDGPIDLVYVVFDKAGNYTENSVHGIISNNPPRLAGFTIKTDYNGDDDVTSATKDGKYEEYKSTVTTGYNPTAMNYSMNAGTSASPVLTLRGKTVITPEIVGGTGKVYYDYKIGTGGGDKEGSNAKELFIGSTDGSVKPADINIQLGDLRKFVDVASTPFAFTFRDSIEGRDSILSDTELTDDQKKSVSAELTVYMGIATAATADPTVEIDPFYWNSSEDNSVYDSNGHIELEDDWKNASGYDRNLSGTQYDADPKVSGQIVIKGRAHDDNRIESINVNFATSSSTFINNATVASFASGALKTSAPKTAYSTNGYWFEITNETFAASGHDVEWKLYLNTEAKGGAAIDAALTVTATNCGTPACTTNNATDSTPAPDLSINGANYYTAGTATAKKTNTPGNNQTTKDPKTAYYRMDIVPYITEVTNSLSGYNTVKSVYGRSALGHYPVYNFRSKGNGTVTYENIKISGYNLADGTVNFAGTSNNTKSVGTTTSVDSTTGATIYSGIEIPTGAKSGNVSITVESGTNTITTLNNVNNNDSHGDYSETTTDVQGDYTTYSNYYNRTPNNKNNNILTDNVYIDIWDFNNQAALAYNNGTVDNLEMKINPSNGVIGFAFSNGAIRFNMPGMSSSYEHFNSSWDYMSHNALAFDTLGYSYGVSVGGDINSGGARDQFSFMSSRWGLAGKDNGSEQSRNQSDSNHLRLDTIGQGSGNNTSVDKARFQSQSITTHKNVISGTDVYMAYYDYLNSEIRFKAGTITGGKANYGNFRDLGAAVLTYANNSKTCQIIAKAGNANALGSAGKYVSIGVTTSTTEADDNVVVIVWYDGTNLMYAYNTNPLGLSGSNNAAIYAKNAKVNDIRVWSDATPLLSNAGEYCQLAVGNDGSIHIAAYDSTNANLKYIYLSKYDSTTPVVATVDSYLDVGEQLTIDVAQVGTRQIPYIGYWASFPEKPRYAYLAEPETFYTGTVTDGAVDNKYTGVWECTVVPSQSSVKDSRKISVGVWKYNGTAEDDGKLAYSTTGTKRGKADGDNKYDESTATTDSGTCYGNGTSNGVLAYVVAPTSSQYCAETAQMR